MGLLDNIWKGVKDIASPIASVVGGWLGYQGSKDRNIAQQQAASAQMTFQKQMSDTAHQREMADLRAAGLNPILTGKYGGSSTPPGAMPVLENVMHGILQGVTSAKMKADTRLTKELQKTEKSKQMVNKSMANLNLARTAQTGREIDIAGEYLSRSRMDTKLRRTRKRTEDTWSYRNIVVPAGMALREINPFSAHSLGTKWRK